MAFSGTPKSREASPTKPEKHKEDQMMVDSAREESKSPSPERKSPNKIVPIIKRRQRDHKNKKRKLRTYMNPDSNLIRDGAGG